MKESIKITYLLFAEYLLSPFPLGTSMPETKGTIRRQALLAERSLKTFTMDFPGSKVVKNPPSNAGDSGSIPGWGNKIPHAAGH